MKLNLAKYQTLVFDCDGVILNSNKVKTQCFYDATKKFGHEAAHTLVSYHIEHGGVSRFEKFKYFFEQILKVDYSQKEFDVLVESYAVKVKQALLDCDIAAGLTDLRKATESATWLVASGGAQDELRDVFNARGLNTFFDGGIFGSPTPKDEIVREQFQNSNIQSPALFLGDSRYDHLVASKFELDFVFITQWSEFVDIDDYVDEHQLSSVATIYELIALSNAMS